MRPVTVFVCGSFRDLRDERREVLDSVRRLQMAHDSMEFFGARPNLPLDECLAEVRRSDVIVVIVGEKYGSVIQGQDRSFSEAEYDEAKAIGLPVLAYLRDPSTPILPYNVEQDSENVRRLARFRSKLETHHTVARYQSAEELGKQVAIDLARWSRGIDDARPIGNQEPFLTDARRQEIDELYHDPLEARRPAVGRPPTANDGPGLPLAELGIPPIPEASARSFPKNKSSPSGPPPVSDGEVTEEPPQSQYVVPPGELLDGWPDGETHFAGPPALRLGVRRLSEAVAVVACEGIVDLYTATDFKREIQALIQDAVKVIVIDWTRTEFIDSTALGILVGAARSLRGADGRIAIVTPNRAISIIFKTTGLDRIFWMFTTPADAKTFIT